MDSLMDSLQQDISLSKLACVIFGICTIFQPINGSEKCSYNLATGICQSGPSEDEVEFGNPHCKFKFTTPMKICVLGLVKPYTFLTADFLSGIYNDSVDGHMIDLHKNVSALWQHFYELSERLTKLEHGYASQCSEAEEMSSSGALKTIADRRDDDDDDDDGDEEDEDDDNDDNEQKNEQSMIVESWKKIENEKITSDSLPSGKRRIIRRKCTTRTEYATSTKSGHEKKKNITAFCHVRPNKALPPEIRPDVRGKVLLIEENSNKLIVVVKISGLPPPNATQHAPHNDTYKRGFHVHEYGNLTNGCESSGRHYNPFNLTHGRPDSSFRHFGDLGNIESDAHGNVDDTYKYEIDRPLTGPYSFINRTLVIHVKEDNFSSEDPDGYSGERIGCCIIQKSN